MKSTLFLLLFLTRPSNFSHQKGFRSQQRGITCFLLLLLVVKAIAFFECTMLYTVLICFFLINRYRGYCPQLKYECGHTYGIATDKLTSVRETSLKCKYCFCLSLLNLTPQTIPRTVLELLHHTYIYTAFVQLSTWKAHKGPHKSVNFQFQSSGKFL